jgi:His-Xaa-Ser system protein HxsD
LEFDPEAVDVDALQRAAYRLSDRLAIDIRVGQSLIECTLFLTGSEDAETVVAEFRNEVIDAVLRRRIRDETEAARNLILALAFSRTGVVREP